MNEDLRKNFEQAKLKLNEAQKQAVETIEGPVLTIAGPGTGKTQVLAIRIGEILTKSVGISPYNILCLTYTDSAANNMRKRLSSFIGKDANKIHISTYHAFCSEVIQYNGRYFEQTDNQSLMPVDDITYFDIMRSFILNMEVDQPLKRFAGNLTQDAKNFKRLFSEMDKEQFTPEFLTAKIKEYEQIISTDTSNTKHFYQRGENKGKPKAGLDNEKERLQNLIHAVNLKPQFDALLASKGFYTFEQMILFVIEAFQKYPDLLLDYQERFQYILVDEYQDTSSSQNQLVFLLAQYWGDNPNIFVVGDDDQSIFRFQGANTENIKIFEDKFTNFLHTIRLDKNYRSSQLILDAAEIFIQQNQDRLLPQKQINAQTAELQTLENKIYIRKYNNTFDEEVDVVHQIKKLIEQGINPSEIAILYRKHKHSENIQTILKHQDIPFELQSTVDILKEKFIQQIIDILLYLSKESHYPNNRQDLLFRILHYNFFNFSPRILSALYEKNERKKTQNLRDMLASITPSQLPDFDKKDVERLKNLGKKLENLLSAIHNLTVQTFVERVIHDLDILQFANKEEDSVWHLEQLHTLFDFIKKEAYKQPFKTIDYFIDRIQEYKKQEEPLPAHRMLRLQNSIKLMTIFASKGLEFQYVFIIKNTKDNWEKARKPNFIFRLPENVLMHSTVTSVEEGQELYEMRRLLYVGMTRAKKQVYLSFAEQKTDGRRGLLEMSGFLNELIDTGKVNVNAADDIPTAIVSTVQLTNALYDLLLPPTIQQVIIELTNQAFIKQRLEAFQLSASSLTQYLNCPIGFYYNYIVNVPRASSPEQGYGKSVHTALKKLYPNFRQARDSFLSKQEFVEAFEIALYKCRSYFTKEEFDNYQERGRYKLPIFYDAHIDKIHKERIVQTEYPTKIIWEGIPLFGILDKLVFAGNDVTIVDYKTGSYNKSKKQTTRLEPPSDKQPNGGDYWRQGAFYKILIDYTYLKKPEKKWKTEKVVFQYIEQEKEKFEIEEFVYTEEHIAIVLQLIRETWKNINTLQFTKGCNDIRCQWCNFAKNHQLNVNELRSTDDN